MRCCCSPARCSPRRSSAGRAWAQWFVDSIGQQDANSVAAVVLFTAVLILLAGLISEIVTVALDPRVRL